LGESGAGKSFAAKEFLALDRGRSVKLINDPTNDPLPPNYERISWEMALKQTDTNLLFEDLITCTKSELRILLKIANYNARHKNLSTVVFIAHDSQSNGIGPLMKHLSHVCLMTSSHSAAQTLASVLVAYRIPKGDRDAKIAAFLADVGKEEHSYWVLCVRTGAFARRPGSLAGVMDTHPTNLKSAASTREELIAPYRKTAEHYLPMVTENHQKCLRLFDFLMRKTPLDSLHSDSLDFTLRDAKNGEIVTVSLFDYLVMITSQEPPTKPLLDLHSFLARFSPLPRCFITNSHKKFTSVDGQRV
jgi:hypothetical protein